MNDYLNLINNFWDNDIWDIDYTKIYNEKVKEIFININRLNNQLINEDEYNVDSCILEGTSIHMTSHGLIPKFNINQNYDIEIIEHNHNKNIMIQIEKLKKDNLNYLKKHVECIPEYHLLLIKLINNKIESYNINNLDIINNNLFLHDTIQDYEKDYIIEITENNIYNAYEKFIKKINIEDTKLYNEIITKLRNNIEINIEEIEKIDKNFIGNKNILVLDTENLLKSIKIQYLLKNEINNYDELFKIWNYGKLYEYIEFDNNITLSEYSNNTKYIEPYMSLSLGFTEKYKLINLFIEKYLINYFVIYTITSKHYTDYDFINNTSNNKLCIPILYNKGDIREQDDHLIVFITYYINSALLNNNELNCYLISNDKFKWLHNKNDETSNDENNILIKNFVFLYDYDCQEIKIKIMNQDMNDLIKIDDKIYLLGYKNFPIINIDCIKINNIENIENIESIENIEDIKKNILLINYNLLKNNIINDIYIINLINKIIQIVLNIYNNLKIIFLFLKNNSKNNIFNYNINTPGVSGCSEKCMIPLDICTFKEVDIKKLKEDIQNYKILCEIYIILKTINLNFQNKDFLLKICKFYSIIILIFDNIHNYLSKIRKLASEKTDINKLFLDIHCTYLYIKKMGITKRGLL